MTLPRGFGGANRELEDLIKEKNKRFEKRPPQIKKINTRLCNHCGHRKENHFGFILKGKCKICMCPNYSEMLKDVL